MRRGQRECRSLSASLVARRLQAAGSTAAVTLVEGGTHASEAQTLSLDPVTVPHPRSPYAVWRRLPSGTRHAIEGSCCQRIPHISRGLSARPHCLCSGVLVARASCSNGDLGDCFSASLLRQLTREDEGSSRTVAERLEERFPCAFPRFRDGVLVTLCDRLPTITAATATSASVGTVVMTLLSAEEAESIREELIRLEEHPRFGTREISTMRSLSSFRMLSVLHSIRGVSSSGSPRAVAVSQQPTNDSTPSASSRIRDAHRSATGDASWLTTAEVPAEAYHAVCQNYLSLLRGGGGADSSAPVLELSAIELTLAHALRTSNPEAYNNFLVEVLQRQHSRSPASSSSSAQVPYCTLLLYDLVCQAARDTCRGRGGCPVNLEALVPWICVIGTELRVAARDGAQPPHSSHSTVQHSVLSELLLTLDQHLLPEGNDERISEPPPPRMDTTLLRKLALHLLPWSSTAPNGCEACVFTSDVVDLRRRLRHKVVRLLNAHAPSDVLALCRDAHLLNPWDVDAFVEKAVALLVEAGVSGLLREGLADLLETAERDLLGGASDDLAGVYRSIQQLSQRLTRLPAATSDATSVILTNLAQLGTLICAVKPSAAASLASPTDSLPQGALDEQPHAIRSEVAFLGGPIEFLRFLYDVYIRFHRAASSSNGHHAADSIADAAPSPEVRSGATVSDNRGTHREKYLAVIQASSTPALQARFVVLLEKVVAALAAHQPVSNAPLAHFVEHHLALPSPQEEYRRVMFLLANVSSSLPPKAAASSPPHAELQTVCASLPQLFLPWSAIKITKQVLTQTRGNSPQFLHLMQTAVDLQLPPSTTRSRVAGILEVLKLLDSQRSKLSDAEYRRLWWRCLASWPLSVFLSSWTFFCTWCAIGVVALLHYGGWSWEAAYIVSHCRQHFCTDRVGSDGSVVSFGIPDLHRAVVVYVDEGCRLGSAGSDGCLSCLQLRRDVVNAVANRDASLFLFLLAPRVNEGTGALSYDDIVHDAAQRIRFAFNSTTNPLSRTLFNLLPITSLRSEEALIAAVARESLRQGIAVDFVLPVPCAAVMAPSTYERLTALFGGGGGKKLHLIAARSSLRQLTDMNETVLGKGATVEAAVDGVPAAVVVSRRRSDVPSAPPPDHALPLALWLTAAATAFGAQIRSLQKRLSRAATSAARELRPHEPGSLVPSPTLNAHVRLGILRQLRRSSRRATATAAPSVYVDEERDSATSR